MNLSEEYLLIFAEMETEFAENQVKGLTLAFFHILITGNLQHVLSSNEGINVNEDSFLSLRLTSLNDSISLLSVTGAEIYSSIVVREKICHKLRETVDNVDINHVVTYF